MAVESTGQLVTFPAELSEGEVEGLVEAECHAVSVGLPELFIAECGADPAEAGSRGGGTCCALAILAGVA